jgi:hypothetical protein
MIFLSVSSVTIALPLPLLAVGGTSLLEHHRLGQDRCDGESEDEQNQRDLSDRSHGSFLLGQHQEDGDAAGAQTCGGKQDEDSEKEHLIDGLRLPTPSHARHLSLPVLDQC